MTKDEALHKALKVLNCLNNDRVYETAWVKGAINACEEALEQPTQEPVAWMHCVDEDITEFNDFQACPKCEPLYTHPKEWQGLCNDEINLIYPCTGGEYDFKDIARAIEAKLKEKNG